MSYKYCQHTEKQEEQLYHEATFISCGIEYYAHDKSKDLRHKHLQN